MDRPEKPVGFASGSCLLPREAGLPRRRTVCPTRRSAGRDDDIFLRAGGFCSIFVPSLPLIVGAAVRRPVPSLRQETACAGSWDGARRRLCRSGPSKRRRAGSRDRPGILPQRPEKAQSAPAFEGWRRMRAMKARPSSKSEPTRASLRRGQVPGQDEVDGVGSAAARRPAPATAKPSPAARFPPLPCGRGTGREAARVRVKSANLESLAFLTRLRGLGCFPTSRSNEDNSLNEKVFTTRRGAGVAGSGDRLRRSKCRRSHLKAKCEYKNRRSANCGTILNSGNPARPCLVFTTAVFGTFREVETCKVNRLAGPRRRKIAWTEVESAKTG